MTKKKKRNIPIAVPRKRGQGVRLLRLAQAIAVAQRVSKRGSLSHKECEAVLEFYVDAESRGEQAQILYPDVWEHLRTCEHCHWDYMLLTEDLLDTESTDAAFLSTAPALSLPFLTPSQKDAPWTTQIYSRIAGAPFHFSFTLRAPFLWNQVALVVPTLVLRDGPHAPESTLLLSDIFSLGEREVDVELRALRSEDGERIQLQVLLASSVSLPEPLRVTLAWNDHQLFDLVHEGRAAFEGILLSELKNSGDLHLEFQAGVEVVKVEPRESNP